MFNFFFFIFTFQKINSFLIISLKIIKADDCIRRIELEDGTILFRYDNDEVCNMEKKRAQGYTEPSFDQIPYELGQKLKIVNGDLGVTNGYCGLDIDISVNGIYLNDKINEFWSCNNCGDTTNLNNGIYMLNCYPNAMTRTGFTDFNFYFKINSLHELNFETSEYFYFLNNTNYFFISPDNFNNPINLIDLYSIDNLYAKNKEEIIRPFYNFTYYKIFVDQYSNHKGKFIGSNDSNIDIELNEQSYSRIFEDKNLRYILSQEEIANNGVHLKLKIGIYNNNESLISAKQDYNFFICLSGYKFCDLETSMKCLNEGYYLDNNNRYYSCYETCQNCDSHHKPSGADYFKNYCNECKHQYPYFVNITEFKDNKTINYKSCYRKCPLHAPQKKFDGNYECVEYCPKFKTNEGKCIDSCDYKNYKYLLKNESICYNYIPQNFFIFIENYSEFYSYANKTIITLGDRCPNDTYDSSFSNFCINSEEDIFHFVENPNKLITYNNPLIKKLNTKEMIIRTYSSDKKLENIDNNKDKFIQIDISNCERKIKARYEIDNDESIIFFDVFNLETNKYIYKVFNNKGEELNHNI